MTEISVDTTVDAAGTGAPNFTTAPTVGGVALGSLATSSFTSSGTAPSSPSNGAVWWDTTNSALMIYANSGWQTVTLGVIPPVGYYGDRAIVFNGGYNGSTWSDKIQYFDITTTGNASLFGSDTYNRKYNGNMAAAGGSRALIFQGSDGSGGFINDISYVTTTTTGNATSFGNGAVSRYDGGACSDGTYAMACNGKNSSHAAMANIDYVTIATTGNAAAFGNDWLSRDQNTATSDGTYGFIIGMTTSSGQSISRFTFSTSGNAISYGTNGSFQGNYGAGFSGNEDYAIHAGGRHGSTNLTQVYRWTWATNTVAFVGHLPASRRNTSGTSNSSRFVLTGGQSTNEITYIDLASGSSTSDFGDLLSGQNLMCSSTSGPAS